jgi:endoglucanase
LEIRQFGDTFGVIGTKAGHLKTAEEKDKSPELVALFFDIGAADRARPRHT